MEGEKISPLVTGLLVCMAFLVSTGPPTSHFCRFVSMWYNLFYFDKIIKYLDCVKIFNEAKLQVFVKMQITRNQPKTFQNIRVFRELNNVSLAELPSS